MLHVSDNLSNSVPLSCLCIISGVKLEYIGGAILACSYSRPELLLLIQQPIEDGLQTRRVVVNMLEDDPQTADEALSSILEVFLVLSKYSLKHVTKYSSIVDLYLSNFCILEF
jgi:hypothetical protein